MINVSWNEFKHSWQESLGETPGAVYSIPDFIMQHSTSPDLVTHQRQYFDAHNPFKNP